MRGTLERERLLPHERSGIAREAYWLENSPLPDQALGWAGNSPAGSLNSKLGQLAEVQCARVVQGGRWGESYEDRRGTGPAPTPLNTQTVLSVMTMQLS